MNGTVYELSSYSPRPGKIEIHTCRKGCRAEVRQDCLPTCEAAGI